VSIAVAGVSPRRAGRRRSLARSISINLKKRGRGADQFSGASHKIAARPASNFRASKNFGSSFAEQNSVAKNSGKPSLTVVNPPSTVASPPRKLGDHGTSLWNAVMAEYHITDRGGVELLAQACAAVDRVEALAERIAADGEVIDTDKGPKPHPALRDELAGRSFVCRTLERLGLNLEAVKPMGHPPDPRRRSHADE
jgi:hypothetical protein